MRTTLTAAAVGILVAASTAQTPPVGWTPGFGANHDRFVAGIEFDDGSGPTVFVSGTFYALGDAVAPKVARLRNSRFEPAGSSASITVNAFAVYDDGSGPKLYACGAFPGPAGGHGLAYWDGAAWIGVGGALQRASGTAMDPTDATCLTTAVVFGTTQLIVGGSFSHVGGVGGFRGAAAWNGASYTNMATGLTLGANSSPPDVFRLAVSAVGGTPTLFGVGWRMCETVAPFPYGIACAKWTGAAWVSVPIPSVGGAPGSNSAPLVTGLIGFDDGGGEKLYLAGGFGSLGGVVTGPLVRYDGVGWSAPPAGGPSYVNPISSLSASVTGLAVRDVGPSAELLINGSFNAVGAVTAWGVAGYANGAYASYGAPAFQTVSWNPAGAVVPFTGASGPAILRSSRAVYEAGNWTAADPRQAPKPSPAYVVVDGAPAPELFALVGGDVVRKLGPAWVSVASRPTNEPNQGLNGVAYHDDGGGPAYFAAGAFHDGVARRAVMKVSGDSLVNVGVPMSPSPFTVAFGALTADVGFGPDLVAYGASLPLPSGAFTNVARWDGSAWSAIGPAAGIFASANAAAVFDSGSGPQLHVAGTFSGGNIQRWTGAAWTGLGSGLNGTVNALVAFDDGSGPALFAAGAFSTAGGTTALGVAKWNGSVWSAVGQGLPNAPGVRTLAVFEDESGAGPRLYAGGDFGATSPFPGGLAKFEDGVWVPVAGLTGPSANLPAVVNRLTAYRDYDRPSLFAHGTFSFAGPHPTNGLARLAPAAAVPRLDAPGGGLLDFTVSGLLSGRTYLSVFSAEGAGSPVGLGPWAGLYALDPALLLLQVGVPLGTEPFLWTAVGPNYAFGPVPLFPGLVVDVATADVTGDRPPLISGVERVAVR
jgi:hypothetical protein